MHTKYFTYDTSSMDLYLTLSNINDKSQKYRLPFIGKSLTIMKTREGIKPSASLYGIKQVSIFENTDVTKYKF